MLLLNEIKDLPLPEISKGQLVTNFKFTLEPQYLLALGQVQKAWGVLKEEVKGVVLLVDWGGDMEPFHDFVDSIVIKDMEDMYPSEDNRLILKAEENKSLEDAVSRLDISKISQPTEWRAIIISDFGAARRNFNVVKASNVVEKLNSKLLTICLNPVERGKWFDKKAEEASVFPLDFDGLTKAFGKLRVPNEV